MNQAKSVKSVKASKQKVKSPSRLVIPERLSFDAITRIQVPEDDEFQSLSLEELTAQVEPTVLAEIERIWTERNNIDSQQGKRSLKFLDRSLANILRWYLRGMDVKLSVRKVRSDTIGFFHQIAYKKQLERERKHTISGFRHGDRIRYIGSNSKYQGREGVVFKVKPDFCLVCLDDEPIAPASGGVKTFDLRYSDLENLTPRKKKKKKKPPQEVTDAPLG